MARIDFFITEDVQINENIKELWHQGINCDLQIICKNDELAKAHSVVLNSAGFEFLVNDLNGGKIKSDVSVSVVEKILHYCYHGTLKMELSELSDLVKFITLMKCGRLLTSIENFLAANIESVPQYVLCQLPFSCLKSLWKKSAASKQLWRSLFMDWVRCDMARRSIDFASAMIQLDEDREKTDESEKTEDMRVQNYAYTQYIRRRRHFSEFKPFYFYDKDLGFIFKYNGTYIVKQEGFSKPFEQTKDIIMLSAVQKTYLEIHKDRSLYLRGREEWLELNYKISAYSLNPPLLLLDTGNVIKVNQNYWYNFGLSGIFEEIPCLSSIIPKVRCQQSKYMEFVNDKYILIKSRSSGKSYTDICSLETVGQNQWKKIEIDCLHYIDVNSGGQYFCTEGYYKGYILKRLALEEDSLELQDTLEQKDFNGKMRIYSFLSSPGSFVCSPVEFADLNFSTSNDIWNMLAGL